MAITETARLALKQYSSGGDPHPTRAEFNDMIDDLENNSAMYSQGITGARPAAGKRGRLFWDETVERLYYDNGTAWKDTNPNGGGGAGAKVTPGVNGIEGVSTRAARADHTHRIDLATAALPGAMSAADKLLLDAATSGASGNALAKRDANGRLGVNTPVDAFHSATKAYVDGLITDTADYVDDQVGPGLTVAQYAPLPLTGYTVSGVIEAVPFANRTLVTGSVDIKRTAGAINFPGGTNSPYVYLGEIIPSVLRWTGTAGVNQPADIRTVTHMAGVALYEKIQTITQPATGRVGVRGDDSGGANLANNGQFNVFFTYTIPNP